MKKKNKKAKKIKKKELDCINANLAEITIGEYLEDEVNKIMLNVKYDNDLTLNIDDLIKNNVLIKDIPMIPENINQTDEISENLLQAEEQIELEDILHTIENTNISSDSQEDILIADQFIAKNFDSISSQKNKLKSTFSKEKKTIKLPTSKISIDAEAIEEKTFIDSEIIADEISYCLEAQKEVAVSLDEDIVTINLEAETKKKELEEYIEEENKYKEFDKKLVEIVRQTNESKVSPFYKFIGKFFFEEAKASK